MSAPVLLTMSGSLRKGSYNRMLIAEAVRAFGEAEVIEGDLNLPLYDGDVEDAGTPPAVQTLMDQVVRADALVIGAPEYNKGISGVLKNAIDWLSRANPPVLKNKVAVILSAAGGRTGGETGHFMTHSILTQLQVNVVHGPLILVAAAQNEFGEDGTLNNDFLKGQVEDRMARLRDMIA
ncbi:NADPH-dependent FMN reductase [Roseovarius sp. M141]|uniref:NADPH-dependent FMN reductase n=1 Tax=Roseovarius sp. M141 TaxID=2583806 RepID=UPI0020CF5441|nr:NADPH-dependent FMN reductase [Roseovarius sp. M141]MCQ0091645.1 NAD(P)H-dependent oxidoreductase [Roseovarius sp. M141]